MRDFEIPADRSMAIVDLDHIDADAYSEDMGFGQDKLSNL